MRSKTARSTLAIVLLLAAPAAAQRVDVQLREEGSRTPVVGAIVRLLGEVDDEVRAQGLSNEGGRITLRAPAAGRYRLKVDRIGWVGLITPAFTLSAGPPFETEVVLADIRMDLPTVEVQGQSVCGRQFDGDTQAANLWLEIHRALTAMLISQDEAIPLHVREFHRELLLNGRPLREWNTRSAVVRGPVYQSLPPPFLAQEGFVLTDHQGDSTVYAVPDAALLVSDDFTGTHCFRTVPRQDGLVGLYFEPIPRRQTTDVRGTMWLDAHSHELRFLEYTYTGLEPLPQRVELGGRVEFERLPNGRWIVSEWHVRTPVVDVVESRRTVRVGAAIGGALQARPAMTVERLTGYVELGGRVAIADDTTALATHAVLIGRVAEPETGDGLAGVLVQVEGARDSVMTDVEGRFELHAPVFGARMVTVRHPRFRVARTQPDRQVLLSLGDTTTVEFDAPTSAEMVRAVCGNPRNRSGVVGAVLDASGGPMAGVMVRAAWQTPSREQRQQRTRSSREGAFGFCNLPPDVTVEITILDGDTVLRRAELELPPRHYEWLEVRVGRGG